MGGRESADNKYKTATNGTERTASYNRCERERGEREREREREREGGQRIKKRTQRVRERKGTNPLPQ